MPPELLGPDQETKGYQEKAIRPCVVPARDGRPPALPAEHLDRYENAVRYYLDASR